MTVTAKKQITKQCTTYHATTSAALKLLRRRLTLRRPGLPDLVEGVRTADALFVIHASEGLVGVAHCCATASAREAEGLCSLLAVTRVGRRDGVGMGSCVEFCRVCAEAATAALAAAVVRVVASLGILLGPCPLVLAGDDVGAVFFRITAAFAVDLVTRAGRASDEVSMPATLDVFTRGLLLGTSPKAGSWSSSSS
jgi:hypothetical protein